MSELTESRAWCKEQIHVFTRDMLRPASKRKGMMDYVRLQQWRNCTNYIDYWSWVMRNSELEEGGLLKPHDIIDVSQFHMDADKFWESESLKRWKKYLCSDGVIRCEYSDELSETIDHAIYKMEEDLVAALAADGFTYDDYEDYDVIDPNMCFVNANGERRGLLS